MTQLIKNIFTVLTITATLLLLSSCAPPADQLYDQGQAAYRAQNYHTAFIKLLSAARGNSVQAQYAVGYLYYNGIGTPRNETQALIWFKKAAAYGNYSATAALQSIQQGSPKPFGLSAPS